MGAHKVVTTTFTEGNKAINSKQQAHDVSCASVALISHVVI